MAIITAATLFLAAVIIAIRYRIELLMDQAAEKVVPAAMVAPTEAGSVR
jgi:hypothetical protein